MTSNRLILLMLRKECAVQSHKKGKSACGHQKALPNARRREGWKASNVRQTPLSLWRFVAFLDISEVMFWSHVTVQDQTNSRQPECQSAIGHQGDFVQKDPRKLPTQV